MVQKARADIAVGVNERRAVNALKRLSSGWGEFATGLNQTLELFEKGFEVAGRAASFFGDQLLQGIDLAQERARAERDVTEALRDQGVLTDELTQSVLDRSAAIARGTDITRAEANEVQTLLLNLGVLPDSLEQATRATLVFSKTLDQDLGTAAENIARALRGERDLFEDQGIRFATAAEDVQELARRYGQLTTSADTLQGRVARVNDAWDTLLVTFGETITESRVVNAALQVIEQQVDSLTGSLENQIDAERRFNEGLELLGGDLLPKLIQIAGVGINTLFALEIAVRGVAVGTNVLTSALAQLIEFLTGGLAPLDDFIDQLDRFSVEQVEIIGDIANRMERIDRNADNAADAVRKLVTEIQTLAQGDVGEFAESVLTSDPDRPFSLDPGGGSPRDAFKGAAKNSGADGSKKTRPAPDAGLLDEVTSSLPDAILEREAFVLERRKRTEEEFNASNLRMQKLAEEHGEVLTSLLEADKDRAIRENEQLQDTLQDRADVVAGFLGSIATGFADALEGTGRVADRMKAFFGDLISGVGELLIQLGSAAVAGGLLGTAVPFLAPLTGGPVGVAAGAAAIAAGVGLVAAGTALGGSGSADTPSTPATARSASPRRSGTLDVNTAPVEGPGLGGQAITIVNNFTAPIVGSDRRAARELGTLVGRRSIPAGAI